MHFTTLTWLVPVLPLAGFLLNFLFLRKNRTLAPLVAVGAVGAALALSLALTAKVLSGESFQPETIEWLSVSNAIFGHFTISVGTQLDALCAMMLVVVTGISFLVHVYSLGYMHDEPGIARFFMYLGLFTFSMLGLVVSPNLYQMYIFWELVGLCSYLLIGFYYTKPEANQACKKAFVVNRVGDFGMFLGILFLSYYLGSASFAELPGLVAQWPLFAPHWLPLGAVALLLFCGAVGKSAQFPLHVWLPDAMEGPTPVSALIHAATMVAAGVYLVARTYFIFDAALLSSLNAAQWVAYVGAFTSIFAATIACTQFDIKRVLAFSTLSQLGYMVMALGVGGLGVTAGSFHLFTHAFFKALLFLGSGSVIHAVHSNDIREMGGLLKKMPVTGWTFLIGCLAIAGMPPLAGFFSKDEILLAIKEAHNMPLYWLASGVAFLTAFYMFRLFFLTFTGSEPAHGHPHESPATMTGPLAILAMLSVVAGFVSLPQNGKSFGDFIHFTRAAGLQSEWQRAVELAEKNPGARGNYVEAKKLLAAGEPAVKRAEHAEPAAHGGEGEGVHEGGEAHSHAFKLDMSVALPATLIGLAGILLSMAVYFFKWIKADSIVRLPVLKQWHWLAYRKYLIDELYRWLLDHVYYAISGAIAWFDRHVVDGLMNGFAWASQAGGAAVRKLQTGRVQAYALGTVGGMLLLFAALEFLGSF